MTAHPCPGASRTRLRALLALVLSVLAAGGLVAPAAHAEDFVAPAEIGAQDGNGNENPYLRIAQGPHVVSAPDGSAYVAWIAPGSAGKDTAMLATRAPGGSWATETIAPATRVGGGVPIGRASDGTLTALVVDPTSHNLVALTRPPGGSFGKPIVLDNGRISSLALAVNGAGAAIAGWRVSTDGGANWLPRLRPRDTFGTWQPGYNLAPTEYAAAPAQLPTPTFSSDATGGISWADIDPVSVAINDSGKYAVALALPNAVTGGTMHAYVFIGTDAMTSPGRAALHKSATGLHQSRVRVTLSPTGALGLTWLEGTAAASPFESNGAWFGTVAAGSGTLAGGTLPGIQPSAVPMAFTKNDAFTILWTLGGGDLVGRLNVGTGTAGSSTITGASQLSPSSDLTWAPSLATDGAGRRLAMWANATSSTIQGRLSQPDADAFGDTRTVASLGNGVATAPEAAFDGAGNAAAAWSRGRSSTTAVQATGLDTVAPVFDQALFPSSGSATTPLSFTASAHDTWSTPKLVWSFGDGATAEGGSASHTYGAPNSYGASVTATDAAGNSTTRSATVAIGSKPAVDADGDGIASDRDCNDSDARVRPGADDIPGNGVDENCDGKDAAYALLTTTVKMSYTLTHQRLTITALKIRGVRVGDRIKVRCSGPGCSRKANVERRVKKVTSKRAEYDLYDLARGLRLRPGAKLTFTMSRDGYLTRISTWTVRAHDDPKETFSCVVPKTTKQVTCN